MILEVDDNGRLERIAVIDSTPAVSKESGLTCRFGTRP
nr:MAG TPA: Gram-negative bacterial TonB protein C-terminal [Caudoviricetes sp.]